MSNRPKTRDAGWVGFSYAVSALLNSRLQRPSLAIADVTHMAVRTSDSRRSCLPFSTTFRCIQENSAVQGRVGAREGRIPETGPCPEANVMNGSAFHANTFYVRTSNVSLSSGVHSSRDGSDIVADRRRERSSAAQSTSWSP